LQNSGRHVASSRKHRVNGWKEIGCDGAFENEPIRTGLQGRFAYTGLVEHADDDHFRLRETSTKPVYHSNAIPARQRQIDDGKGN
jgi:hypothetical protein